MRCFNRNVLIGLAGAAAAIWILAPSAASAAIPLLVALACPLSMVVMMRAMGGGQCHRDEAEPRTRGAGTVGAAEAEIARLRSEVDQLRVQQAELTGEAVTQDMPPVEDRRE